MGIFSRLSDIVNSNIVNMLDKAENPEKMIRLMISEMEDTLVEIKSETAKVLAEKKYLERKVLHEESEISDWNEKAEFALTKDREDLARAALVEKRKKEEEVVNLKSELSEMSLIVEKYRDDISKLESKLNETRAKQKSLQLRAEAASNQLDVRKRIKDASSDQAILKMESFEKRVDLLEGKVEVEEMGAKSLKDQFKELEEQSELDKELAELKAKMNK